MGINKNIKRCPYCGSDVEQTLYEYLKNMAKAKNNMALRRM
jgi:hypothetical protein